MSAQPLVLVTGATGAVGLPVVQALLRAGYRLRLVARHAERLAALAAELPNCEWQAADLTNPDSCRQVVRGVFGVVHLAAQLHLNNPDASQQAQYRSVNYDASLHLAAAAQAAGVQRFIFASTISVYGCGSDTTVFTESSQPNPQTLYARTKWAAEQAVRRAFPAATILRLAAVYGAHMQGNYQRLARAIQRGRFFFLGTGSNRRTLVYEDDVAAAIGFVLGKPQPLADTYNVTSGEIVTVRQIVQAICAAWQRPLPWLTIPLFWVHLGLVPFALLEKLTQRSMLPSILVAKWLEDVAVSGAKLQSTGFKAQFDLNTGWRLVCGAVV